MTRPEAAGDHGAERIAVEPRPEAFPANREPAARENGHRASRTWGPPRTSARVFRLLTAYRRSFRPATCRSATACLCQASAPLTRIRVFRRRGTFSDRSIPGGVWRSRYCRDPVWREDSSCDFHGSALADGRRIGETGAVVDYRPGIAPEAVSPCIPGYSHALGLSSAARASMRFERFSGFHHVDGHAARSFDETAVKGQHRLAVRGSGQMQGIGKIHAAFRPVESFGKQRRVLHRHTR